MKKRLISLVLSVIFILTLIPAAAITSSAASAYYRIIEFPILKHVESVSEAEPGEQVFEFEIISTNAQPEFDVIENTVTTNGTGYFEGKLSLGLYSEDAFYNLMEGFTVREKPLDNPDWSCDTSEFFCMTYLEEVTVDGETKQIPDISIYNLSIGEEPNWNNPGRGRKDMYFTNYYLGDGTDNGYYFILDVPIRKFVESVNGQDPGEHTFTIEIVSANYADSQYTILDNTVTSTGVGGYFEGHLTLGIPSENEFWNLSEGFTIREKDTGDQYWTFDTTEYIIEPYVQNIDIEHHHFELQTFAIYNQTLGQEMDYQYHRSTYDAVYFTNTYDAPQKEFVTLTYDPNGGTVQNPVHTYKPGSTAILDEPAFREGYTFTGWYDEPQGGTLLTTVLMDTDRTVYAGWEKTAVPPMLNGSDHSAYVKGYPDGTVKPSKNITRAEVTMIFYRLLKEDVRNAYHTTTNGFTDVKSSDWFNEAVSTMANLGIIKGRTSTTFAPNEPITRAEYATICARFDDTVVSELSMFTDISDHWAKSYIMKAAALGWIRGYTDGTFRPNQQITRAESITLTNRVLQRLPQNPSDLLSGMIFFPDNADITKWYYLPIQEATNSHDYMNESDGREVWTKLRESTMP